MIIDIRCRYITQKDAKYFEHSKNVTSHDSPESYFSWLTEKGIDVAVSPAAASLGLKLGTWDLPARDVDNNQQIELQNKFPKRFVGVAGIDPGNVVHNGLEELERCAKKGLRVATIEPGRKPRLVPNPADRR